ncbi:MAG: hypothetical protein HZC28_08950 [Spirochaetes bacterium]|nr:hypothetical protein [Spirochaetota bacterium]
MTASKREKEFTIVGIEKEYLRELKNKEFETADRQAKALRDYLNSLGFSTYFIRYENGKGLVTEDMSKTSYNIVDISA